MILHTQQCYSQVSTRKEKHMTDHRKKLGSKIKKIREESSITREELSILTAINYNALMRIENGQSNPKLETLVRITRFLGIELKELFEDEAH
jgi:transcriptional regulator with XRE-family HTH domain